jgi:hypothetical protein
MTVAEMIRELEKYPLDTEVGICIGEHEIDIKQVVLTDYFGVYKKVEIK